MGEIITFLTTQLTAPWDVLSNLYSLNIESIFNTGLYQNVVQPLLNGGDKLLAGKFYFVLDAAHNEYIYTCIHSKVDRCISHLHLGIYNSSTVKEVFVWLNNPGSNEFYIPNLKELSFDEVVNKLIEIKKDLNGYINLNIKFQRDMLEHLMRGYRYDFATIHQSANNLSNLVHQTANNLSTEPKLLIQHTSSILEKVNRLGPNWNS